MENLTHGHISKKVHERDETGRDPAAGTRPLSQEEIRQRQKLASFLSSTSEDEFIERVLLPLFQRMGSDA
jgi:hypothetical protein